MSTPEQRLEELGIVLPDAASPVGSYVNALTTGDLVLIAGHGPVEDGRLAYRGRVPDEVSIDDAAAAARLTMLNCLATLRTHLGSLDRVAQVVKVLGLVRATEDFEHHATVLNGASDLLQEVFGERGTHTRSAIGVASLPFGIPVEIEMMVRITPS
jgi:enamine deaminase RidA (YjgF/YER057c/UK114 family)